MSDRRNYGTAALITLAAVALILLSNIPLIYGYLNQPSHLKFMGIAAGVRDVNFYFMLMTQADGWWPFLRDYFAPGEPNTIYHGFFWFFLGKVARVFGVGDLAAYHGARVATAALFVLIAYWFVSWFLKSKAERIAALIMLSFGAGAGWLQMIAYHRTGSLPFVPADVGNPETTPFFLIMSFPHISAALVLILLCFGLVMASISQEKLWLAAAGGACGLVLGFIHGVNLLVIYAALGLFSLICLIFLKESRPIRSAVVFGVVSVWPISYYLYLVITLRDLLPQLPVRSPIPLAYLVGFAPFLILSAVHVATLIRSRTLPRGDLFLLCWAAANSVMLYSYPLLLQEARTVLGLQIPLVILSSRAIFGTVLPLIDPDWQSPGPRPKRVLGAAVVVLMVALTFPSSIYNIYERVYRLKNHPEAFSLTHDEYKGLRFLREATGDGVVLSADRIGNYVPRMTHKYSWLGLYDLPSHDSRLQFAERFFSKATAPSDRYDFLNKNNIGFIFHGRDERKLGEFEPGAAHFLKHIHQSDDVDIYEFEPGDASSDELGAL